MNARVTPPAPRVFSPQQLACTDWAQNGSGSAFIEAVAGAGKTSTLIEMLAVTRGSVAFAAYNTKIASEIKLKIAARSNPDHPDYDPRIAALGNKLRVGTFHSFGFQAWRRLHPSVKSGPEAAREKADMTREKLDENKVPKGMQAFVLKLVSLAKQRAIGLHGSIDDESLWYAIVDHFDLAYEIEEETSAFEPGLDTAPSTVAEGIKWAIRSLKYHIALAPKVIDFDDMIYMPVVSGCRLWENDWILVDEAQDTNPCRRALARKMLRRGGRAAFVGDRAQAIYGFCHPAGVPVLTADGWRPIEALAKRSPTIVFSTSNDASGWQRGNAVQEVHQYSGHKNLLRLVVKQRSVDLTFHHKVPVKIDRKPVFYTYIMKRNGAYRAGYCASHTTAGNHGKERRFMFSQRCKLEGAEKGWLLASYYTREEAIIAEAKLHMTGIVGASFYYLDDDQVAQLDTPTSRKAALIAIAGHGRSVDFPIWRCDRRHHFEINIPFITEACNIMTNMRVQVLGGWDNRKRGRSRHLGRWEPVGVQVVKNPDPKGRVYGITVKSISESRPPLYAAGKGGGIIVHNTGADSDAIYQIVRDFNCQSFPLTVTYRCPKTVVEMARAVGVSNIEAHETAPQGTTRTIHETEIKGEFASFTVKDAILCRNTKPLVAMAYTLIKAGVACHVEGRDIGAGLLTLVNKFVARDLEQLRDKLETYRDIQTAKLMAKGKEAQAEALTDRVDTIFVIADQCQTVDQLRSKIAAMFVDGDNEKKPTLTLSTVHKSKGREWSRVFVLGRNAYMPSRWARQDWQQVQEANLIYVAYTRAMEELILIDVDPS